MSNMENWREKILRGDIAEAARRTGVSVANYALSQKTDPANWTPSMIKINMAIKGVVEDRERQRAEFMNEAN